MSFWPMRIATNLWHATLAFLYLVMQYFNKFLPCQSIEVSIFCRYIDIYAVPRGRLSLQRLVKYLLPSVRNVSRDLPLHLLREFSKQHSSTVYFYFFTFVMRLRVFLACILLRTLRFNFFLSSLLASRCASAKCKASAGLLTSSRRSQLAHFIGSAALYTSLSFQCSLMNDVGRRCAQVAMKFWHIDGIFLLRKFAEI